MLSVSKAIFELVLEEMNDNSYDEIFDGNYVFKFTPQPSKKMQDFHILRTSEDSLEPDAHRVVPFVDVESIEIPFNEANQRSDWEKTFYIAIRMDITEKDYGETTFEFDYNDTRWQALMEVHNRFKEQLTFSTGDFKASFKVREPQKVNVFKHKSAYYQIFALSMNIVKITQGRFGNEMSLYLGSKNADNMLDPISTTVVMGKTEQDNTPSNESDRTLKMNQRTLEVQTTINYRGTAVDKTLLDEALADTEDIETAHTLIMEQTGDFDLSRQMVVTSANIEFKNNAVERIALTFKRSKGA